MGVCSVVLSPDEVAGDTLSGLPVKVKVLDGPIAARDTDSVGNIRFAAPDSEACAMVGLATEPGRAVISLG
jgi:hypothetical protein